jgi:hypothetical protein
MMIMMTTMMIDDDDDDELVGSVFLVFEYCEHDMANLIDNMGKRFSDSEVRGLHPRALHLSLWLI